MTDEQELMGASAGDIPLGMPDSDQPEERPIGDAVLWSSMDLPGMERAEDDD